MPDKISQKIIVNLEANMPLGRLNAQCAHSSLIAILNCGYWENNNFIVPCADNFALKDWLSGNFTKVMLRGWGSDMLLNLKEKAEKEHLPVGLMEEDGFVTALAIGPAYTDIIDKTIGKLVLL